MGAGPCRVNPRHAPPGAQRTWLPHIGRRGQPVRDRPLVCGSELHHRGWVEECGRDDGRRHHRRPPRVEDVRRGHTHRVCAPAAISQGLRSSDRCGARHRSQKRSEMLNVSSNPYRVQVISLNLQSTPSAPQAVQAHSCQMFRCSGFRERSHMGRTCMQAPVHPDDRCTYCDQRKPVRTSSTKTRARSERLPSSCSPGVSFSRAPKQDEASSDSTVHNMSLTEVSTVATAETAIRTTVHPGSRSEITIVGWFLRYLLLTYILLEPNSNLAASSSHYLISGNSCMALLDLTCGASGWGTGGGG